VAALALWATMTRARSPWALPVTLAAVPAAFYAYLLATGTSLADAQDAGWVLKPEVSVGCCCCGPAGDNRRASVVGAAMCLARMPIDSASLTLPTHTPRTRLSAPRAGQEYPTGLGVV
jgi:hypothetical protein